VDRHAPYHARQVYEGQYGEKADVWSLLGERTSSWVEKLEVS
jgi:hypothetical protein